MYVCWSIVVYLDLKLLESLVSSKYWDKHLAPSLAAGGGCQNVTIINDILYFCYPELQ